MVTFSPISLTSGQIPLLQLTMVSAIYDPLLIIYWTYLQKFNKDRDIRDKSLSKMSVDFTKVPKPIQNERVVCIKRTPEKLF